MPAVDDATLVLKPERDKPVRNQHPWVFSGALARPDAPAPAGGVVRIVSARGEFLARGYANPISQIRARLLTWDEDQPLDDAFWRTMLEAAIARRAPQQAAWRAGTPNAVRLVNAENDFVPGLVVDRYADWLVLQALTLGIDQRKQMLADLLMSLMPVRGIYERSDVDVRQKEGLRAARGVLAGEATPELITIDEDGLRLPVDVARGHKTGFYLDQRANRALVGGLLASSGGNGPVRVLNLFSYTGAFGLHALAAGADAVVNVDSSTPSLALGEQAAADNSFSPSRITNHTQDAFQALRGMAAAGEQFDLVVCDPPKFAQSASQVDRAARGYKDLNLHAFRLVKPGGHLMTFSCSGAVGRELFRKIVFGALADSGARAQTISYLGAAHDHPVALTFPEGEYLKGLVCRVV